ncbi:uncharacterized protein GIQ15_05615 [Arthroderma uncinatum]|uniref:uncharacterized protein n=1 Tax=Arthroderma uncinatum TaxID=74035 RepID=UPI00144A84F0|nr:uncharacterized protein GIQ15_05615 [Arthroderma uncinatum]KAF3480268.1 hypothetical protein GIQ15_05615 [Arthroderma uncinatum]
MFRLLPWSSIARGEKVTAHQEAVEGMAVPEQNQPPAAKPHSPQKLKRKRSDSAGSEETKDDGRTVSAPTAGLNLQLNTPHNTSSKVGNGNSGDEPASSIIPDDQFPDRDSGNTTNKPDRPKADESRRPIATQKMDTDELRQTLESQLSLEVLLKHDELRLIEQEMAKCQVALEQLRRCAEIPYPGSSLTGPSSAVSNGTGPAIIPRSNPRLPASPSPWGTNDGAYTRHYARWLLPDPRFDGGEIELVTPSGAGKGLMDGRTTRASWADTTTSSSRSQRGGSGAKLQALSSGYPPPKDKVGPMIIKRKSDGLFVKLVCLDCRRDNFSSTQGFINHCRIAHNRSFASHDAAASASGEPVEVDEAGTVVGGQSEPPAAGPAGYVHPLIRSALAADSTKGAQQVVPKKVSHVGQSTVTPSQLPKLNTRKRDFSKMDISLTSAFKASPQTPHLSSLMHWKGIDIDLSHIVEDALTKPDVDMLSSDDNSDSDAEYASHAQANHASSQLSIGNNRLPTRTVYPSSQPQRPVSQKGMDKRGLNHRSPGPLRTSPTPSPSAGRGAGGRHPQSDRDVDMVDSNSPNLSPNTVESNQAPSLVSDDGEEYEARSESESPSPSLSGSDDEGNDFDNVEVQDGDDTSADSNASDSASHLSGPAKHHTRPPIPTAPTRNTATRKDSISKPKHSTHINSRAAQKPAATARSQKGDGKKRHR